MIRFLLIITYLNGDVVALPMSFAQCATKAYGISTHTAMSAVCEIRLGDPAGGE